MTDRVIWKFPFNVQDAVSIVMPAGASVVHVDEQRNQPCIWAAVDPDAPRETRRFRVIGTGRPIPDNVRHVATWQSPPFVWHLFEGPY